MLDKVNREGIEINEARVLSYEELKGWTAPVWLEMYSHRYDGWALIQPERGNRSPVAVRIVDGDVFRIAVGEYLYGSTEVAELGAKRCWTAEPTDEQRRDAPWAR